MFRWLQPWFEWSPESARARIESGSVPRRMRLNGRLDLSHHVSSLTLPERLTAAAVDLSDCPRLTVLPHNLQCQELIVRGTGIESLHAGLDIALRIDAQDCRQLTSIAPVCVPVLSLIGCTALAELPEGLNVRHLNLQGCVNLARFPDSISRLDTLNVRDCSQLEQLPEGIAIRSWIDLAGAGLRELPWSLRSVRIHWRGVPVSDRVAFAPETITIEEILNERNLELRRVLIERVGLEWFVEHARATVIDRDTDAGGERQLLKIPFDLAEDVLYVQVQCPSTGKRYLLRVPPTMSTCRQAIAWTAGFDNADDYKPVVET